MTRVAFVGLGVMGYPMAGHLCNAGHQLAVYNRTAGKTQQWLVDYRGQAAESPAAAAENAEFVISCVGNDDDLRNVAVGTDGAFAAMAPGAIYIDHSTTSASLARELAETASELGIGFIDAPVSGGQSGAERGALTVMCGGSREVFDRATLIIDAYASACTLIGPSGAGQMTKMVNQICIAGLLQGLSEGLNFGMAAGLDMDTVIDVISKGAAQSWQLENRAKTMCEGRFDFGFAVDWMLKDLGIVLDEARRNGASLPVTEIVQGYYSEIQARGGNRWDTSSLIERLKMPAPSAAT